MKKDSKLWSLHQVYRRKNKINPQPQYQRTEVWNEKKKQLLIDSVLREYDIPKFYLRECKGKDYQYEVIDGQQRLRAIWSFYEGKYEISGNIDFTDTNLAGKKFSELDSDIQEKFDNYELSIVIIEEASDSEIRDLFLRLQQGVTLNPAEKRNAIEGNMRDFIEGLVKHKIFNIIPERNKRFIYADWLAHVVCLELAGGPKDVKAKDLYEMYETQNKFNMKSVKAKKIKKILDYIHDCFNEEVPELNIKWGFVDFYLLISLLLDEKYMIENRKSEFGNFYIGFEKERREVEEPSELIKSDNFWSNDLYNYIQAFLISGGISKNIKIRNEVYTRKLFHELMDLQMKDNKRNFSENQRIVIWRRDERKCQMCKKEVKLGDMEADHIKAYSNGGQTTINNGQTLCKKCNSTKGAK